ncbi:MAG TPA: hypothetical protein VGJ05_17860 [Fimbriiglobus sp.]|jgi:hypothetical protein
MFPWCEAGPDVRGELLPVKWAGVRVSSPSFKPGTRWVVSGPVVAVQPTVRTYFTESGLQRLKKWAVLVRRFDGTREAFHLADTWEEAKRYVEKRLYLVDDLTCMTRPVYRIGPNEFVTEYTPLRTKVRKVVSVSADWSDYGYFPPRRR